MFALAPAPPQDWQLIYEKSKFVETGRYDEVLSFCKRLDEASPNARVLKFGTSGEGRPMIALAIGKGSLTESKKPTILLISGIHAGEVDGKDADLMLARRILISKKNDDLLDRVNIIMVPVFNVDGHERFSPYNRINQNGPKSMGWRTNAENLNLNRDFVKADTPEMRAMLKLFNQYKPDFFIDNHVTDGGDWQYDSSYAVPVAQTQDLGIVQWTKAMIAAAEKDLNAKGYLLSPYFSNIDPANLAAGLSVEEFSPRYSTGFGAAINRPSMLAETHVLKPYKRRVETTFNLNLAAIEYCAKTADQLKKANAHADALSRKNPDGRTVVLSVSIAASKRPFTFLGYEFKPYLSEISGAEIPGWDRSKKVSTKTTIRDTYDPEITIKAPYAYAIPPEWDEAINVLDAQGIGYRRTKTAISVISSTYKFDNVRFPRAPFEGRFIPSFAVVSIQEERRLPAGTALVGVGQLRGKLVCHLLEPAGPDSLMRWGFFNAVFEEKEFFEDYAMEPIAKKMLAADSKLRKEFQDALKDPAFANNPRARLAFFWNRSKYADIMLNKYPVVKLTKAQVDRIK